MSKSVAKSTNYAHYFDDDLARIMQVGQGMTISFGSALENFVANQVESTSKTYKAVDATSSEKHCFLHGGNINSLGIKVKKNQKKTDFILLDKEKKELTVIEMKSGSMLDTAKATGEKEYLEMYRKAIQNSPTYKNYKVSTKLCAFSATEIDPLLYKNKFSEDEIITGKEFCKMVGISQKPIAQFFENAKSENSARMWEMIKSVAKNH